MSLKIVETRVMWRDDLRKLCIECDWFTYATNPEYDKFLDSVYGPDGKSAEMTADRLLDMALEIQRYSDPDTCDMGLEGIVYLLCRICFSAFEITDGGGSKTE